MRATAVLLWLLTSCTAAWADLTTEERFQDCIGSRAEAEAFATWADAPCQAAGSCVDFAPDDLIKDARQACVAEIVEICAARGRRFSADCFDEAQPYLDRLIAEHAMDPLLAKLEVASHGEDNLLASRAIKLLEQVEAGFPHTCSHRTGDPLIEDVDRACLFEQQSYQLLILDVIAAQFAEVELP